MQSKQTFSILFWIEKSRINNGEASLYARITVSGKRAEIATHRKVPVHGWNSEAQILSSKTPGAKELNNYLAIVKAKLLNCQSKLEARGMAITPESLKKEYSGVVERPRMFIEIVQQHNNDIKTWKNVLLCYGKT